MIALGHAEYPCTDPLPPVVEVPDASSSSNSSSSPAVHNSSKARNPQVRGRGRLADEAPALEAPEGLPPEDLLINEFCSNEDPGSVLYSHAFTSSHNPHSLNDA